MCEILQMTTQLSALEEDKAITHHWHLGGEWLGAFKHIRCLEIFVDIHLQQNKEPCLEDSEG